MRNFLEFLNTRRASILLFTTLILLTGCSATEQIADKAGDAGREVNQGIREGEQGIENIGEIFEEARESGKKFRNLKEKDFIIELVNPLTETVKARLARKGEKYHVMERGDYARWKIDGNRFVESVSATIIAEAVTDSVTYTTLCKVQRSFRKMEAKGNTEVMVVYFNSEGIFSCDPPQVAKEDRRIRFEP